MQVCVYTVFMKHASSVRMSHGRRKTLLQCDCTPLGEAVRNVNGSNHPSVQLHVMPFI
ncbi:hypothetical protein FGIG_11724 [Fasciola gigantica]|uniref:Uncharacterized protein n=1 Tax=Fasciola gigantica TaxID=46835 RepID=A0A504ZA00_FASGI|nr:hypothetical protein FGIG_11724 [Fasciola gigantica]